MKNSSILHGRVIVMGCRFEFALIGFEFHHFPRNLANSNEWKLMFEPSINNLENPLLRVDKFSGKIRLIK